MSDFSVPIAELNRLRYAESTHEERTIACLVAIAERLDVIARALAAPPAPPR